MEILLKYWKNSDKENYPIIEETKFFGIQFSIIQEEDETLTVSIIEPNTRPHLEKGFKQRYDCRKYCNDWLNRTFNIQRNEKNEDKYSPKEIALMKLFELDDELFNETIQMIDWEMDNKILVQNKLYEKEELLYLIQNTDLEGIIRMTYYGQANFNFVHPYWGIDSFGNFFSSDEINYHLKYNWTELFDCMVENFSSLRDTLHKDIVEILDEYLDKI